MSNQHRQLLCCCAHSLESMFRDDGSSWIPFLGNGIAARGIRVEHVPPIVRAPLHRKVEHREEERKVGGNRAVTNRLSLLDCDMFSIRVDRAGSCPRNDEFYRAVIGASRSRSLPAFRAKRNRKSTHSWRIVV
jgi:hypothetical protein